jgi:hypothetical protein
MQQWKLAWNLEVLHGTSSYLSLAAPPTVAAGRGILEHYYSAGVSGAEI